MDRNKSGGMQADGDSSRGSRGDGGYGDEAGTRVGRPDPGQGAAPSSGTGVPNGEEGSILKGEESRRGMTASDRASTGAGAEAAEGLHSTKGKRPEEKSGVDRANAEAGRGDDTGRSGSEPLQHREAEHKSGYGGEGAAPKTSSDQR